MRMVLSRDLQRRAQIAAGAVSNLEEVPMRAWVVDTPGPIDTGPLVRIRPADPGARPRDRCWSVLPAVACAGRTCTWPRATSRRTGRAGFPVTRWSEWSMPSDRVHTVSGSETASVCRGWLAPMAAASTAVVVTRTSAARRSSPDGISTAGMRTRVSPTRRTSTACRTRSTTSTPHPCCVPGSSAIARCAAAALHQAAGSASTGSAAAPTSPRRSPCTWGCGSTC